MIQRGTRDIYLIGCTSSPCLLLRWLKRDESFSRDVTLPDLGHQPVEHSSAWGCSSITTAAISPLLAASPFWRDYRKRGKSLVSSPFCCWWSIWTELLLVKKGVSEYHKDELKLQGNSILIFYKRAIRQTSRRPSVKSPVPQTGRLDVLRG